MRFLAWATVGLAMTVATIGCKTVVVRSESSGEVSADAPAAPAEGGVAPMSAVPNAPVVSPQAVEGAGMGGVGNAAKDAARRAAGSAGSPAGGAPMGEPDASGE